MTNSKKSTSAAATAINTLARKRAIDKITAILENTQNMHQPATAWLRKTNIVKAGDVREVFAQMKKGVFPAYLSQQHLNELHCVLLESMEKRAAKELTTTHKITRPKVTTGRMKVQIQVPAGTTPAEAVKVVNKVKSGFTDKPQAKITSKRLNGNHTNAALADAAKETQKLAEPIKVSKDDSEARLKTWQQICLLNVAGRRTQDAANFLATQGFGNTTSWFRGADSTAVPMGVSLKVLEKLRDHLAMSNAGATEGGSVTGASMDYSKFAAGGTTMDTEVADLYPSTKAGVIATGHAAKLGLDTSGITALADMHMPKNPPKDIHPVVTDPANFTADVRAITKAHPSLLYAAAVMRPSLALAQGHALSLLQGLDVKVHEFSVSPEIDGFQQGMIDTIQKLKAAADAAGLVSSCEEGLDRAKGRRAPATLRFFARRGQVGAIVVMFSGSVIMMHEMQGFPEGVKIIEDFARAYTPREKGFIHHLAIVDGKIQSTRYENNDDGYFPDEAYPFIHDANGGANAYVDRYLSSKSAIMNLYGLAGTGKSTFMRKAATRAEGRTCMLVDNPMFYQDPNAASALIQHLRQTASDKGRPMLMLEEADEFIKQKDNSFLPQLLSLTSGVLTVDIKIMIATNLMKIDDLVAAMQRSGRTFGNVEFHRLTPTQAVDCHKAFNLPGEAPVFKKDVPLSDVLSEGVNNIGTNLNGMGMHRVTATA